MVYASKRYPFDDAGRRHRLRPLSGAAAADDTCRCRFHHWIENALPCALVGRQHDRPAATPTPIANAVPTARPCSASRTASLSASSGSKGAAAGGSPEQPTRPTGPMTAARPTPAVSKDHSLGLDPRAGSPPGRRGQRRSLSRNLRNGSHLSHAQGLLSPPPRLLGRR